MRKIDTVLFDFDGTLVDTNELVLASWRHAFRELTGAEPDESEVLSTFGEPIDDCVSRLLPDKDLDEVKRVYRGYQFAHFEEKIRLFPGMYELVTALHKAEIKMAIVTNRLRNSTELGLRVVGLADAINCIVAVDDAQAKGLEPKPEPDSVRYALELLGAEPEATLLVGDTLNDIISGNRAGVTTVRVAWAIADDGAHDTESAEATPDYIIQESSDLLDIIAGKYNRT